MSLRGTSRTLRAAHPAHYTVKIKAFSVLVNTKVRKYDSGIFAVGDFKWRLCLWPNGHVRRGSRKDGTDHVSLFLTIAETASLPNNWEADVNFKMFVFDHNADKYLTIQEDDGKIWRFNETKFEWGYPQLLSTDELYDSSTGYLVEDEFTFGVEISVLNPTGASETFSRIKHPLDDTYTWTINNFSELQKDVVHSDVFAVAEYKWTLVIYPNGYQQAKGKYLSLYLKLDSSNNLPRDRKIYVDFKLRVKSQFDRNRALRDEYWFSSNKSRCGFMEHILLSDLNELSKGYIFNDALTIEAKFLSITQITEK